MILTTEPFRVEPVTLFSSEPASPAVSRQLSSLADRLTTFEPVLDVAIGYLEIVIYLDAEKTDAHTFINYLAESKWLDQENDTTTGYSCQTHHRIPLQYSGEDLETVASWANMSIPELIQRHKEGFYTVAMLGFKPHFPFLHGLDPALSIPRLPSPRSRVKAGAVAIAAGQAGIYPCDTPGGWHILGYCNPDLCLGLNPGDTLQFEEIKR